MNELLILSGSAISLGFLHTLFGPDHYLPFIVLSKARGWSLSKTIWIAFFSGIGHVGSSILIGFIGILLGTGLSRLEFIESFRGEIVAWMLFAFGLGYTIYGLFKYFSHGHHHFHLPSFLKPKSIKEFDHLHLEEQNEDNTRLTPWVLFLIFVFGPCEILIPLLLFPAYDHQVSTMVIVALVFTIATLTTMLAMVYLGYKGMSRIKLRNPERYLHLSAGLIILISASGMLFLGW